MKQGVASLSCINISSSSASCKDISCDDHMIYRFGDQMVQWVWCLMPFEGSRIRVGIGSTSSFAPSRDICKFVLVFVRFTDSWTIVALVFLQSQHMYSEI